MRKFWLTMVSLLGMIGIILIHPTIDPFNLGMGLGLALSPMAASNAYEHMSKNTKTSILSSHPPLTRRVR